MGGNDNLIKVVIFSLVLAALLYPGLEKLYLYRQTYILEDLVMGPLAFLGENQTILSNNDKFTRYGTNYKSLDLVRGNDLSIGIKQEFKFHERWINLTQERNRVTQDRIDLLSDFHRGLSNEEYSLIIYGPGTPKLDLYHLVKDSSKFVDNYCEIFLLSTEHKCLLCSDVIRVFFKYNQTCNSLIPQVIKYYTNNFYKICRADELIANTRLKTFLMLNGFFMKERCSGGGRLLIDYNSKSFRINDLLNLLYLSLVIIGSFFLKFKMKLMAIIFVVIIILLFLPLNIFNDSYISKQYVNESAYAYSNLALPIELSEIEELKSVDNKWPVTAIAIGVNKERLRLYRYYTP